MPLLRSTDPLRKNDVLASNLLFAFLAIAIAEQLVVTSIVRTSNPSKLGGTESMWVNVAVWAPLVLGWLAIGACYYAIRKGKLWAKLLVLVLFLWRVYSTTFLPGYTLAGIILCSGTTCNLVEQEGKERNKILLLWGVRARLT